ncbi:hypothetical protein SADUNF_Sadunf15G0106500 [Salix dunnii]|uniref:Uncharacterized protein n=1 Tax=Salix dunnii TaxID=1413687 RepID=A0A835JCZ9_9ROSI|nr:hypothetical protein SADUNF_Sadunf15G0106500 [Salix dunnii]
MSAIPQVFKRLFMTFLWVSLLMLVYNSVFFLFVVILIIGIDVQNTLLVLFSLVVIGVLFLVVHVYITGLWHLASVVSVLEPIYGFAAMKKSYELLKGKIRVAGVLVFGYLSICGLVSVIFSIVVVHGGDNHGVFTRIIVGGFLVGVLVIVNLVGLLVQSVFYYVCKSYHHQGIDKTALHEHLGGYLGETAREVIFLPASEIQNTFTVQAAALEFLSTIDLQKKIPCLNRNNYGLNLNFLYVYVLI